MQNDTQPQETQNEQRADIHQRVTETIIAQLEAGVTPWQCPWQVADSSFKLPQNGISGRNYNGVNILLLWGKAIEQEFTSNQWASFRQWSEKKESIRKGEKGTMITYTDFVEKEQDGEIKKIPFLKSYVVFNKCQLSGYKPEDQTVEPQLSLVERLAHVAKFVEATNVPVKHQGARACYNVATDTITLPKPKAFMDTEHSSATENYYSTLSHELIHATGHEKRLDRTFGKRFGDETYAAEELVAELGAAFLCAELDISREPRKDHASYIANWLKSLKNNKYLITGAAAKASQAVDYLKKLQPVS